MRIGSLEVTPLSDGEAKLPPQYFPNADWAPHRALLGPDGMMKIPLGCFLIRTDGRTLLVDAGIGPVDSPLFRGGDLPGGLEKAGVRSEDVDLVVCSHLHVDHVGWLVRDGRPFFPNATVRFGAGDHQQFVADADPSAFVCQMVQTLEEAGRLELIDRDGEIAPGVSTLHAPGHTLGHLCLVLSSGEERAMLLGDAVTCPVQVEEPEWEAMSDIDPKLARRTREALWRELESSGTPAVAAHFPGLEFGRILRGEGKRYFA